MIYTIAEINCINTLAKPYVQMGMLSEESLREIIAILKQALSPTENKDEYLTMNELIKTLKISRPTVYRIMASKKIRPRKIGRQNRFLLSEVRQMLNAA
jgi:excisionase family DNA binding protein